MGASNAFSPASARRIAGEALTHVLAEHAAREVLTRLATSTTHPDALADRLLALLVDVDDAARGEVVRGFLRPVAKCIEASVPSAAKVASTK